VRVRVSSFTCCVCHGLCALRQHRPSVRDSSLLPPFTDALCCDYFARCRACLTILPCRALRCGRKRRCGQKAAATYFRSNVLPLLVSCVLAARTVFSPARAWLDSPPAGPYRFLVTFGRLILVDTMFSPAVVSHQLTRCCRWRLRSPSTSPFTVPYQHYICTLRSLISTLLGTAASHLQLFRANSGFFCLDSRDSRWYYFSILDLVLTHLPSVSCNRSVRHLPGRCGSVDLAVGWIQAHAHTRTPRLLPFCLAAHTHAHGGGRWYRSLWFWIVLPFLVSRFGYAAGGACLSHLLPAPPAHHHCVWAVHFLPCGTDERCAGGRRREGGRAGGTWVRTVGWRATRMDGPTRGRAPCHVYALKLLPRTPPFAPLLPGPAWISRAVYYTAGQIPCLLFLRKEFFFFITTRFGS